MNNGEKIFLAVAALGVVTLLIYRGDLPSLAAPEAPLEVPVSTGHRASYMIYNYPGFGSRPIGNVMPSKSNGQIGQVGYRGAFPNFSNNPNNDCGCGG